MRCTCATTDELDGTKTEQLAVAFMLFVSFSRFQIDKELEQDMEEQFPDYRVRQAFGIWSSFQTARRISEWQNKELLTQ